MTEEDAVAKYGEENVEVYMSYMKPLEWTVSSPHLGQRPLGDGRVRCRWHDGGGRRSENTARRRTGALGLSGRVDASRVSAG
eukprot:2603010-Pyramimonas_sp.AAC.1